MGVRVVRKSVLTFYTVLSFLNFTDYIPSFTGVYNQLTYLCFIENKFVNTFEANKINIFNYMMKFFKRFQDLGIEGAQAKYYDKMTREHRVVEMKEQAKEITRHIKDGDSVLEVAPGAGYLSIELSKLGKYKITGMDISRDLVEICTRNAIEAGVQIDFQQGNVSEMPFQSNLFNFIICVLAFKNFKEPLKALEEMHRVLKPGGTALIMDLNRKASMRETKKVAVKMGLKGLKAYIAGAIQRSGAYSRNEFETFISQTEFKDYEIRDTEMGFSVYLKK
jgi:ubiquinone/menaquinone biosynthesis C-methylase UbiE